MCKTRRRRVGGKMKKCLKCRRIDCTQYAYARKTNRGNVSNKNVFRRRLTRGRHFIHRVTDDGEQPGRTVAVVLLLIFTFFTTTANLVHTHTESFSLETTTIIYDVSVPTVHALFPL